MDYHYQNHYLNTNSLFMNVSAEMGQWQYMQVSKALFILYGQALHTTYLST